MTITAEELARHLIGKGHRIQKDRTVIPEGWVPPPALVERIRCVRPIYAKGGNRGGK